jgi:hypothetical protein
MSEMWLVPSAAGAVRGVVAGGRSAVNSTGDGAVRTVLMAKRAAAAVGVGGTLVGSLSKVMLLRFVSPSVACSPSSSAFMRSCSARSAADESGCVSGLIATSAASGGWTSGRFCTALGVGGVPQGVQDLVHLF